ncbi:hypothetical protein E3T55_05965 [Cryobacterium frigoriphilum]|uniref:Uncharacterized protein n=1 Tax=Cryobacterium frigoriphilum TaxID=1259150 RepID=A0A4R9A6A5_9MICO|nr:hypothetical protein [Cryobacterium frigoriphilum]TFD52953.1 hypothetical protein E3T55_05965 [Cryobacterium frigoriphilum]
MQSKFLAKIFGDRVDPRLRLEKIFGEKSTAAGPPPSARAWAVATLELAGIDPAVAEVRAIKCLLDAEPRLTLRPAGYLVKVARTG